MTQAAAVVARLRRYRLQTVSEAAMQASVAAVLECARVSFEREVSLTKADRIDFLTADGVGIELKIDGSENEVARQLIRYAEHERVRELLLVTTRSKHLSLPREVMGKPLTVYIQGGLL